MSFLMQSPLSTNVAAPSGVRALPPRPGHSTAPSRSGCVPHAQGTKPVQAGTKSVKPETATPSRKEEEIYLGFDKYDTAPREGRKGRVIKDDPRKYPTKDSNGFFLNVVGGWAGGEAGLQEFIAQENALETAKKNGKVAAPKRNGKVEKAVVNGKTVEAEVRTSKGDVIYLGFDKDDFETRRSGAMGRFIKDDGRKYPSKEDVGPMAGATGGFAGGEVGLKTFVQTGEIPVAEPEVKRRGEGNPLITAGIVALGATTGGLLLTNAADFSENVVRNEISMAPIDDNTKILLATAIVLLGTTGAVYGVRVALKDMSESVTENIVNIGKFALFWVVVFIAARLVLTS